MHVGFVCLHQHTVMVCVTKPTPIDHHHQQGPGFLIAIACFHFGYNKTICYCHSRPRCTEHVDAT